MGSGLLSRWLSSHYHSGAQDEMSMAHHTVNLLTSTIKINADRAGQQSSRGNRATCSLWMDYRATCSLWMKIVHSISIFFMDGLQGSRGNRATWQQGKFHLVPRINGEMPSVDEAISDHQSLLDRFSLLLSFYDNVLESSFFELKKVGSVASSARLRPYSAYKWHFATIQFMADCCPVSTRSRQSMLPRLQ